MDILVEFCRTGTLGPLRRLDLNALEVQELLGRPDSSRDSHGEADRQIWRWNQLFIRFGGRLGDTRDLSRLRISLMRVHLPPQLPAPLAAGVTEDWSSTAITDVLSRLHAAGVAVQPDPPSVIGYLTVQDYVLGDGGAVLHAVDGVAESIETLEQPG